MIFLHIQSKKIPPTSQALPLSSFALSAAHSSHNLAPFSAYFSDPTFPHPLLYYITARPVHRLLSSHLCPRQQTAGLLFFLVPIVRFARLLYHPIAVPRVRPRPTRAFLYPPLRICARCPLLSHALFNSTLFDSYRLADVWDKQCCNHRCP